MEWLFIRIVQTFKTPEANLCCPYLYQSFTLIPLPFAAIVRKLGPILINVYTQFFP